MARNSRSFPIAVALLLLVSILLVAPVSAVAKDCSNTSTGLIPLIDLGTATYQGEEGGLYPGGSNEIPAQHLELGLELASQVVPRAEDGTPDDDGLIGFTSIGVSNTVEMFKAFTETVSPFTADSPLVLVNGAQRGRALGQWASPTKDTTWKALEETVAREGLTAEQIQVAWVMLPPRTRGPRTLADARDEMEQLTRVLQFAKERYPNLVLAYLSSREYGGYISDSDSEPNAYNHGFHVKWMIEEQMSGSPDLNADSDNGTVVSPWIAWGPYLWADGTTPRSDGLTYACQDFTAGGVHPGREGEEKIATLMVEHFTTDPTAADWFPQEADASSLTTTTVQSRSTSSQGNPVTSSTPGTTLDPVTSTLSGVAEEGPDDQGPAEADRWPSAVAGVGIGLTLGAVAGFAIRRTRRS